MNERVLNEKISVKPKFDSGGVDLEPDIAGVGETGAGLEEEREGEFVREQAGAEHGGEVREGAAVVGSQREVGVGIGADERVEEEGVVEGGGGGRGEEEGVSEVEDVERGGGGDELGEDEGVGLEAGFEEECGGLEEAVEGGRGVEEGEAGLFCRSADAGSGRRRNREQGALQPSLGGQQHAMLHCFFSSQ